MERRLWSPALRAALVRLFSQAIAAAGATVLALGRDAVALDWLLTLPGSGHSKIVGDVCDTSALAAGLDGKIVHAVINNAGIAVTAALLAGTT